MAPPDQKIVPNPPPNPPTTLRPEVIVPNPATLRPEVIVPNPASHSSPDTERTRPTAPPTTPPLKK
ncbi:hypothetical protein [Pyxidicoccus caerfyrddinensis]|uniref:hypothetical protein n=1 Tax=Pyxidicoccus caerfyrddinensis TaxID=2709663 RepID=UPI0013DA43D6|nr:hypothetical protein [Pyxidicoccus caerfyrddinensis]